MFMQKAASLRLSIPATAAAHSAEAGRYEFSFSLAEARVSRRGEDFILIFPCGAEIVCAGAWIQPEASSAADLPAQAAILAGWEKDTGGRSWTVGQFREEKFMPHRMTFAAASMETGLMQGRWKNHIRDFFGGISLQELSAEHFEEYVRMMRSNREFGDTTTLHCLVDLRRMWNYARRIQVVDRTFPGRETIREVARKLDNEKKCYLEEEEAALLVRVAYERRLRSRVDHDVYCYVILGLCLGLRAGDIHKLNRQSVERRVIEKTKNGRCRFAHFNFAPVKNMLEERFRLYPPADPHEPLFRTVGRNAKTILRQSVPRKYFELVKELGFNETVRRKNQRLERIDFHALRHTFATLAAMRGVGHLTLMRLMGHRTPAMTLRYIEIADAHQARHQEQAMRGVFPEEFLNPQSCP